MRVSFLSFGCKVNQAENEDLKTQFFDAGFEVVNYSQKPDFCIINTCTVTELADKKSRQKIRQLLRINPKAQILITGCLVQSQRDRINEIDSRIVTVGNPEKNEIIKFVEQGKNNYPNSHKKFSTRARGLIKIQDGCSNFCSYCIVPFVRGREKSIPTAEIISNIKLKEKQDFKEIILTGINIGKYQDNLGQKKINLTDLIGQILAETNILRIRLTSIEPLDFSLSLIKIFQNKRLCRHLHLPLQSGSNSVLKRMGRKYKVGDFEKKIKKAREAVPEIAITTDVIVGFPGETNDEFDKTINFIKKINFAKIHVFKYSKRSGTKAARMPNQISGRVKKDRSRLLISLGNQQASLYRKKFIGQKLNVLFEQKKGDYFVGLSDNYIRVFVKESENLIGTVRLVKIKKIIQKGAFGELI